MKKVLLPLLFIFSFYFANAQYDSIYHAPDAMYRTYQLYVPPSYNPANPTPLVIAMHGGFGSGPQLQTQSKLSIKAFTAGFIVVYPEGVNSPLNIRTWNAGGCCGYAVSSAAHDVEFIDRLIDSLDAQYNIDTTRIYATGMSNGAFMSYRLACELSHRIAAIAPVAGSMNVSSCVPSRPVPIIHFHSYQDMNVPYQGGVGSGASSHWNPPTDSVLTVWSGFNSCSTTHDTIHDSTDYLHVKWDNCSCGTEMEWYMTHDGGHSWPGGNTTGLGDPASTTINANNLMWSFFQQHSLNCLSTGISEKEEKDFSVYPNPASTVLNIQTEKVIDLISLYNITGELVLQKSNSEKNHSLKIENLPAGIYLLQVRSGEGLYSKRVVVTR